MATLSTSRGRNRPFLPGGRGVGLFLLTLFLYARFRDAFGLPFLNDDYVFLDHVSRRGFWDLWGFRELAFHWWRPWSREFHYWWLQKAFGPVEWPFHLASLVLGVGVLTAFWALARRLAGAPAAAIAVAGAATLPGWGLLMLWPAGAQDLWMLLLSLLALLAWRADRVLWAAFAFALALASKETAATLPLLFVVHDRWIARKPWIEIALRVAPALAVALAWAFAHPLVLGRVWSHAPVAISPSPAAIAPWSAALKSALAVFSLDRWPAPEPGWRAVWWDALRGAFLLVVFVELLARPDTRPSGVLAVTRAARLRGALPLSFAWWASGTLPLLLPGLGWHAYYAHFAALGAWLGLGRLLARQTGAAIALVAVLAVIGAGRAATPSEDWGEAAYQRRAGAFVNGLKERLMDLHPKLAPHTRLWFVRVPNNVGFMAGDGPVVRVWYRDPTLSAGYYSAYRARAAGEPAGRDLFFRIDEAGRFLEVNSGDDTTAVVDSDNPRWQRDHLSLAGTFASSGDWRAAAKEFRRLAIAFPDSAGYAFDAATAYLQAGDSAAGFEWLREAARRPGAPPEAIAAARALLPVPKQGTKPAPRRDARGGDHAREPLGPRRR